MNYFRQGCDMTTEKIADFRGALLEVDEAAEQAALLEELAEIGVLSDEPVPVDAITAGPSGPVGPTAESIGFDLLNQRSTADPRAGSTGRPLSSIRLPVEPPGPR